MVFKNILLSLIAFNSRPGIEFFSFFLKKFFVKIICVLNLVLLSIVDA